ncbi:MAG: diacylglycerol/polyprenol kinase family protein [Bdellovibrio sp.]|jgi:diacylglycerol kinase (CTP)
MPKTLTELGISMVELKKRSEIHWARKLWHILGVSVMTLVYAYAPYKVSLALILTAWLAFVPADFLRHRSSALNDFLMHLFKPLMRDSEAHNLAGTTYLLTGVLITIGLFPFNVAILTLLFLAFADPFASYFGIRYGKDKIFGHKSVQGTLAAFLICALLTAVFLYTRGLMMDRILIVTLLGGLIGALAELIPIAKLDDNLTLPLISATFLWLLFALFGAV